MHGSISSSEFKGDWVQQFAVCNLKLESHKLLHSVTPSLELLIEPFNYCDIHRLSMYRSR